MTTTAADLSVARLLDAQVAVLAAAGVASPRNDAAALAAHALGIPMDRLRTMTVEDAPRGSLERLEQLVAQRAARVPLQLLIGEVGFRTLTLRTAAGVFIPRPETEVVAGVAIDLLASASAAASGPLVAADVCTGSGPIALSLAVEVAGLQVIATDRSAEAVALAGANLERVAQGLAGPPGMAPGSSVDLLEGDLLAPLDGGLAGHIALIVSNPPYLSDAEFDAAEPEVRDHDPKTALVGGAQGGVAVTRLINEAPGWLRRHGWLVLEVASTRAALVAREAQAAGYESVDVIADLAARDRVVGARWPWAGRR